MQKHLLSFVAEYIYISGQQGYWSTSARCALVSSNLHRRNFPIGMRAKLGRGTKHYYAAVSMWSLSQAELLPVLFRPAPPRPGRPRHATPLRRDAGRRPLSWYSGWLDKLHNRTLNARPLYLLLRCRLQDSRCKFPPPPLPPLPPAIPPGRDRGCGGTALRALGANCRPNGAGRGSAILRSPPCTTPFQVTLPDSKHGNIRGRSERYP